MDQIKMIYDDNCKWLTFAEAKHTALIALNIAFVKLLMDWNFADCMVMLQKAIIFDCMVSLAVSIYAIMPFNNYKGWLKNEACKYYKNNKGKKSEIYYIKVFTAKSEYQDRLKDALKKEEFSEIEYDWVNQIIAIAEVTTIKTMMFETAAMVFMISIGGFLFSLVW